MRSTAVILALLLTPRLQAQQPTTIGQSPCTIEGVVLKSTTGQPLKRALITTQRMGASDNPHTARTDSSGHFVLKALEPGEYSLWVNRDGYLGMGYGQEVPNGPGKLLKLAPGEEKKDLVFRLIPTGAVIGRVYDEDGEPISGVNVQALRFTFFNGHRQLSPMTGTSTNDLGEYRLAGVSPGKYYLAATYNQPDPGGEEEPEAYAPLYYPGTSDPGAAAQVDVQAGEETPVDFNLTPVPAVRVRGRITSAALNRSGVGVNVTLINNKQLGWTYFQGQTSVNPAAGTFEIRNVPPGSYTIMAQMWDRGRQYNAVEPVEVGTADVEGVTLQPTLGSEIQGRARVEGGAGSGSTQGSAPVNVGGLQVFLQPREPLPIGVQPATIGSDGSFIMKDVPDGSYTVNVCCLPHDLYLKAARAGGDDVLDGLLTVSQGQVAGPLELVISAAGGHIDGVVERDQKPFLGATVVLVPDSSRRGQPRLYSMTTSDQQGRFAMGSIPPGDYELFAWEKAEDGAYLDPDFLSHYRGSGKTVHVDEGGKLNVDLELIAAGEKRQ
jgi:Carboxypeptidase regulatory-like domain